METFLEEKEQKRRIEPVFVVALLIGAILIGGAIFWLSRKPSMEVQTEQILQSSYREGSPQFAELSRDIIISTDDDTTQSPMGTGTISMFIRGNVRNKGIRTITALELNVSVVTQFNDVLRERRMLAVPQQRSTIGPGETIPVTLQLDGFAKDDDRANIRWKVTAIKAD